VSQGGPKVRLACGKVNLDPSARNGVGFPASREETYGSDIPPAKSAAHQQAWIPRAHEGCLGSRGPVSASEEGTQASRSPPAVQTPESLTGERFPRRVRLTRGSDLTACWEEGRRWRTTHLELAWRPNQLPHPRVGFVVPRFQSTAVARNRLRRRLRELMRRELFASLPARDIVVRARRSAYAAPFAVLRADLAGGVMHVT